MRWRCAAREPTTTVSSANPSTRTCISSDVSCSASISAGVIPSTRASASTCPSGASDSCASAPSRSSPLASIPIGIHAGRSIASAAASAWRRTRALPPGGRRVTRGSPRRRRSRSRRAEAALPVFSMCKGLPVLNRMQRRAVQLPNAALCGNCKDGLAVVGYTEINFAAFSASARASAACTASASTAPTRRATHGVLEPVLQRGRRAVNFRLIAEQWDPRHPPGRHRPPARHRRPAHRGRQHGGRRRAQPRRHRRRRLDRRPGTGRRKERWRHRRRGHAGDEHHPPRTSHTGRYLNAVPSATSPSRMPGGGDRASSCV